MSDKVKQVMSALDMLTEDTSVPRNIRKGATDAKSKLAGKDPIDVRAMGAMSILDDLANDPNIPMHGRTLIYGIMSQLEIISQSR
ncbi:MAG: UPF0147 family protein [Euryarchaeota archaeon]|jgi:uncharacterized protein (UPF0147 family)|nr:UPF0147 family protein [Euryarchaeota archaeon]